MDTAINCDKMRLFTKNLVKILCKDQRKRQDEAREYYLAFQVVGLDCLKQL